MDSSFISSLPKVAAIYAMYGGTQTRKYVAYVGITGNLKDRIIQHLVRRDSSITTGAQAVSLNPDKVTEIRWWQHEGFSDGNYRAAAETVAFEVLDPVLRSRGNITEKAKEITSSSEFKVQMRKLLKSEPAGNLVIPNLKSALDRIAELERKLAKQK